jgi:hypothetical protein
MLFLNLSMAMASLSFVPNFTKDLKIGLLVLLNRNIRKDLGRDYVVLA